MSESDHHNEQHSNGRLSGADPPGTTPSGDDTGGDPSGAHPPGGDQPPRRRDDTDPLPIITPPRDDAATGPADGAGPHHGGPPAASEHVAWWRWAVLAALLVVAAVAVANTWLAWSAERRIAEEVERELGAPVDVALHGFPVGLRSLWGEFDRAELHGRDVPLPETAATLTELHVSLQQVHIDRGQGRLEAGSAEIEATLDDEGVEDLLGVLTRIPLVGLELRPGTLRLNVAGFAVADATATAEGGDLVFRLASPLDRLVPGGLRLDDFPFGLRLDDVRLAEGEMRLRGRIEPLIIDSGP